MKTRLRGLFFLVFSFASFMAARAQTYALSFNPANSSYVDCGNNSLLNASNIRTMECWVKLNSLATDQEILSRSISGVGIELLVYGGNLAFYCMNGTNFAFISYPGSNLTTGVWYHVAVSWDGSTPGSLRLYVNGVSVGTMSTGGSLSGGVGNPGTGTSFRIGQWSDAGATRYLNGTVDEARVWSVTRTAAQIKAGMYGTVSPATTGLIAYYKLNDGSGAAATNSTANPGLNGTLVNSPSWVASPVQWSPNALAFDGVNDKATALASSAYDLSTGTVEFWAMPTNWATGLGVNMCMLGVRGGTLGRYSFHLSSGAVGIYNGLLFTTLSYAFSLNQWYHFAFVCNGTSTTVYINGVAQPTTIGAFGTATGQPLVFGQALTATGFQEPFAGALDEVRIWNTQRTSGQILAGMNQTMLGNESGLVGLFSMDEALVAGTNTGMTTMVDGTIANNHATLANFSLSGTTSNWISHSAISLPVEFSAFTAQKANGAVLLNWQTAQEQNSKEFVIERSTDNLAYTAIGTVEAAGNSSQSLSYSFMDISPLAGKDYYRLKEADLDGKYLYSPIVAVNFDAGAEVRVSPNPANTSVTWWMNSAQASGGALSLTDLAGRVVLTRNVQWQKGANQFVIGVSGLPPGGYVLTLTDAASGMKLSRELQIVR
ncbi:LamG-like jellyroll fold domain-containing protein [Puia sp.]|jgi:hypothetical protein|uniref:LamG-like jellyroll fold domain-containing protein n=1 Tax=Puia sp. TaxID=2045100 RepID=UPI002F3F4C66